MQNGKVHHHPFDRDKELYLDGKASNNEEARTKQVMKKLKKENELLKKQLVRKWSGRSRTSLNSRLNEIDELASNSDYEEDTKLLFMEHSTFHGVRDYYISQKSCLRWMWGVILLCAFCGSCYGIGSIIIEYVQRPYFISYFVQEAGFNVSLPDVVICPFNRFNKSYLEELNVSRGLAQYMELSYPMSVLHGFQKIEWNRVVNNLDTYHHELEDMLQKVGNVSYKEFLRRAGIDCKAFFYDESVCEGVDEIMTSAGKCFRLSGGQGDGYGYGIQVVIRLPKHLYHAGTNQFLNDGIAVKLVEKGRGADNDLTFIPSGVHAIMPLKATKYEFKNDPPRYNCEEKEIFDYGRVWCFDNCMTEDAETACNCSLAASQNRLASSICTTSQFFSCFAKILFDEKIYYDRQEICKKRCRHPCSYWQYDKTVSYTYFPSEQARAFVKDEEEFKSLKNVIILDIFFTSLDFTVIKHLTAFTFSSFIAQIGGQISLWIGGSIISLIQLVIYCFMGGYKQICRTRRKIERRRRSRASQLGHLEQNHIRSIYKEEGIDNIPGAQL